MLFRAYPLFTLREGLGFWPAAILLSLLFGAFHLSKPGENPIDLLNLVLLGLFLCFTVQRTGSVWFAVGFHAAFDFCALFVYAAPNGGEVLVGHLLDGRFAGPAWLTGGALGPEASLLMVPLTGLRFVLFNEAHTPST